MLTLACSPPPPATGQCPFMWEVWLGHCGVMATALAQQFYDPRARWQLIWGTPVLSHQPGKRSAHRKQLGSKVSAPQSSIFPTLPCWLPCPQASGPLWFQVLAQWDWGRGDTGVAPFLRVRKLLPPLRGPGNDSPIGPKIMRSSHLPGPLKGSSLGLTGTAPS